MTNLQRQKLKAAYWGEETMKVNRCRFHRVKIIPKWKSWRRHLGMKCHLWELTSKPKEHECRWIAVLLFRKGYEKHDGEKAGQNILYLWTNPKKGVYGAALNEYWICRTEHKIQEDTDLWRSGIATGSFLEQLSLGSREYYPVGGLGKVWNVGGNHKVQVQCYRVGHLYF